MEIGPCFVVGLDLGTAKAFGLACGFPGDRPSSMGWAASGPVFARNADRGKVNNRL